MANAAYDEEYSYAVWRTDHHYRNDLMEPIFPQKRYENLSKEDDFYKQKRQGGPRGRTYKYKTTHSDVGRNKQAFYRLMKPVAISQGVDF